MKSTNRTKESSERANINYRATFTGAVYATPIMFNPSAADLRRIKDIPAEFEVNEPNYERVIKENDYRIISLLCKFNPNKALKLKQNAYGEEVFVDYRIYISNRAVVGKTSGKTQVIDCHNQNAWILLSGKTSLEKQILKAQQADSQYHDGDPIRRINAATARIARQGEVALYDLVFRMSTLDRHRINEEDESKTTRLDEFYLGEDPVEVIENIFNGEYTALNMLMADNAQDFEGKEYFVKNGENNPLGIFLGVRPNQDGDKIYHDVLAPFTVFPVGFEATFRATDRLNDYSDIIVAGNKLGESKLSKKAVAHLTHDEYPWSSFWGNSLSFQEVTIDDLPKEESAVTPPPANDDLPF
jgi:hypothetical protein